MDIFDGRQEGRGISIQYNILYKDCRTVPAINKIYCVHGSIKKQHFCKKKINIALYPDFFSLEVSRKQNMRTSKAMMHNRKKAVDYIIITLWQQHCGG